MKDKVISHQYEPTIYPHINLLQSNYFSFTTEHFARHSKLLLITILNDQIIIGKAHQKPTSSDHTLITHWKCSIKEQFTSLYLFSYFYALTVFLTQILLLTSAQFLYQLVILQVFLAGLIPISLSTFILTI